MHDMGDTYVSKGLWYITKSWDIPISITPSATVYQEMIVTLLKENRHSFE